MFEWIMQNWLLLTACSGALYLGVLLLEKFVNKSKQKNKEIKTKEDVQL